MKITVLSENSAAWLHNRVCLAEWGLSLFLEFDGEAALFDSGQRGIFLQNAAAIGVDVERSDVVVLSHHHWDHTGGLRYWEPKKKRPLISHPRSIEKMPLEESRALQTKFEVTTNAKPSEFLPGVFFLGQIPRSTKFEVGKYQDDPMEDDSAIAVKTDKGTIVVTGCSHAGVCNISRYAREVTGQQLRGVIGGFHLLGADDSVIEKTVGYLKNENVEFLYPMHCVDHVAMAAFWQNFGVKKFGTGDSFEVE